MTFPDFVSSRLKDTPRASIDFKSMTSFLHSARNLGAEAIENNVNAWVTDMIDNGLSVSSRRRYLGKLKAVYSAWSGNRQIPEAFATPLRDLDADAATSEARVMAERLGAIFDIVVEDARSNPHVALFLYMLLNATADIASAIMLRNDEYIPVHPVLDDILLNRPAHHRRRYIFNLEQSRKREPQLVREALAAISLYLRSRGIRFPSSAPAILSIWCAKARSAGLSSRHLKATLGIVPPGFEYLDHVIAPPLSIYEIRDTKNRVAEAFAPSGRRWYAVRFKRSSSVTAIRALLEQTFTALFSPDTIFYPLSETAKRVGRKMVTVTAPILPGILFINVPPMLIGRIDTALKADHLGYVLRTSAHPLSPCSIIDTADMLNFQRMIGIFTPDIKIELTTLPPMGVGRRVRITGGIMAGYTGIIHDIKDNDDNRLLYITLTTNCTVKVAIKIPESLVQPVD